MAITINAYHGTRNLTRRANLASIANFTTHYTGGTGSAKNNCIYFSTGDRKSSADYFIDKDGAIWEYNDPLGGYYSWHCGDGGGRYGITNANSIGVEVVSDGEDFTPEQVASLSALYAYICQALGRKLNIVRHYDASRKHCPAPYVDEGKWGGLRARIADDGTPVTTPSASVTVPETPAPTSPSIPTDDAQWMASLDAECARQGFSGWPTIRYGARGGVTRHVQVRLNALGFDCGTVDGIFGAKTKNAVKSFQESRGLTADCIVGPLTWAALANVGTSATRATIRMGSVCQDVREAQTLLNKAGFACGKADGIFGVKTEKAVRAFQAAHGLDPDGIIGKLTWPALLAA